MTQRASAAGSKKFDLSKWKYAELRDAINTSCGNYEQSIHDSSHPFQPYLSHWQQQQVTLLQQQKSVRDQILARQAQELQQCPMMHQQQLQQKHELEKQQVWAGQQQVQQQLKQRQSVQKNELLEALKEEMSFRQQEHQRLVEQQERAKKLRQQQLQQEQAARQQQLQQQQASQSADQIKKQQLLRQMAWAKLHGGNNAAVKPAKANNDPWAIQNSTQRW